MVVSRLTGLIMKILLQDAKTGLYLSRGGCWSDNPHAALAFLDEIRASDYRIYHHLSSARVVKLTEPVASDICSATLAASHNPHLKNEPIMNASKNTQPMSRQTEAKRTAPKPARRTSPARKRHESAGDKTAREPIPGTHPPRQEVLAPETVTVVEARIDVGLGNALFIRGQGDGLTWDKGQRLECIGADTWIWKTVQAREKIVFKLLLNDMLWAQGEDLVLEAGRRLEVVPSF